MRQVGCGELLHEPGGGFFTRMESRLLEVDAMSFALKCVILQKLTESESLGGRRTCPGCSSF